MLLLVVGSIVFAISALIILYMALKCKTDTRRRTVGIACALMVMAVVVIAYIVREPWVFGFIGVPSLDMIIYNYISYKKANN